MKIIHLMMPLLSALIGTSAAAQTETYEYSAAKSGRAMQVSAAEAVVGESPMPCRPRTVFRYDASHVVAMCDDKPGLLVVDITKSKTPVAIEMKSYDGKLLDVYVVGDKVWIDIKGESSGPLVLQLEAAVDAPAPVVVVATPEVIDSTAQLGPTPADAQAAAAAQNAVPTRIGKVLKVDQRDIVVDFGTNDRFRKGDNIELYSTREIQLEGEIVKRYDTVAIGRIKSIDKNRAVIEVGMNEDVGVGTSAKYTLLDYLTHSDSPPRNDGSDEISVTMRPYLTLGALGGGAIIDASWMHRFENPVAVELSVSPIGIAITNQGNAAAFAAHGFVTFDSRVFQVGLGLGAARSRAGDLPPEIAPGREVSGTEYGVSAGQYLRLGARDGFNLIMRTNFVVRNKEWDFGGLTSELQAPLRNLLADTWLIIGGGGGLPGHTFFEVGLRTLVKGNGNKGSVFVTPTIGYGNISTPEYEDCDYRPDLQCQVDKNYGGPMVGVKLEWRP